MTPIFFNYSSYPNDHYEDHLNNCQFFITNSQASSSSKPLTTHQFLSSKDQNGIFNSKLQHPQYQHEGENFGSQAYNDHGIENNNNNNMNTDLHQVNWMSSKMRVMLKMKKSDHHPMNLNTYSSTTTKLEEHKLLSTSMEETDHSSNSSSLNNNISIRVCSDCNTTKTPLWRSGPRGPKSLCNACGIRQRKARRAMAATAANGDSCVFKDQSAITPLKVTTTKHKDLKKPNKLHVTKYKKKKIITTTPPSSPPSSSSPSASPSPSPSPSPPSSSPARKNCREDFLASLSKNLTLYHVLPQDEKEAAILLMALSCHYAHDT